MEPEIRKENVETLLDKKFLRVYDLKYAPGNIISTLPDGRWTIWRQSGMMMPSGKCFRTR